jgi:hypothetical protein
MAPTHEEVTHELGDGWTAVWDATNIPAEVTEAFDAAREPANGVQPEPQPEADPAR